MSPLPERIAVGADRSISALWLRPTAARLGLVLAHGAGAGMAHPFMAALAQGLAERGVATLRYQFPYMEAGSRRPDTPALAHAAVRAAVAHATRLAPDLAWFAGGKSYGARMASQAQAASPLAGVRGLVCVGFPLHPPGKPADERAVHLSDVTLPMLFLQGTRDELADESLMRALLRRLGPRASCHWLDDADHSFHVPARSGRRDEEVLAELLDEAVRWMRDGPHASPHPGPLPRVGEGAGR
jgi:uncharacterized protein